MVQERMFQSRLIKRLKDTFDGLIVLKNDANYLQGIPDWILIFGNKWAFLECKKSKNASFRPNQEYYLEKLNAMSFARAIYPENEDEVITDLANFFRR